MSRSESGPPRSRRICPFTGRTGAPLQQPAAMTTWSAWYSAAPASNAASTPQRSSPPAASNATRSARTTERGSTWWSCAERIAPGTRGDSRGSSRRASRPPSQRTSSPSDRWKENRRRSSSASPRSAAATSAPEVRYPVSTPEHSNNSAANAGHSDAPARFSRSSASSPNSASVTGASIPAATPDAPSPGASERSSTSTLSPSWAQRHAQARPITPAPTTTTSCPVLCATRSPEAAGGRFAADRIAYAGITRIRFNGRRRPAALSARSVRAPVRDTYVRACDGALLRHPGARLRRGRAVVRAPAPARTGHAPARPRGVLEADRRGLDLRRARRRASRPCARHDHRRRVAGGRRRTRRGGRAPDACRDRPRRQHRQVRAGPTALGRRGGASRHARLELEQGALHLDPARVAGERAVGADDAVARHDDRDRVQRVRAADGAARRGPADPRRDLGVRRGLAVRDRANLVPHAPLELRAGEPELEVELGALAREVLLELDRGGRQRRGVALGSHRIAEAEPREREVVTLERQSADRA